MLSFWNSVCIKLVIWNVLFSSADCAMDTRVSDGHPRSPDNHWTQLHLNNHTGQTISQNIITTIKDIVFRLKWIHLTILFTDEYDLAVPRILVVLESNNHVIYVRTSRLDDSLGSAEKYLLDLHAESFQGLYFLVLANCETAFRLLQLVDGIDATSRRTTDFQHHSFWIVTCLDVTGPIDGVDRNIRHLENVAFLSETGDTVKFHTLFSVVEGRRVGELPPCLLTRTIGEMKTQLFPNVKYGLNNRKLTILTKKTWMMEVVNGTAVGYLGDILNEMAKRLNFSYDITDAVNLTWAGRYENGSWKGMIGEVVRREIDMIVASLSINEERERDMDFLLPSTFYTFQDVAYRVEYEDPGPTIYLKAFHGLVLATLLGSLLLFTVLVAGVSSLGHPHCTLFSCKFVGRTGEAFQYLLGILIFRGGEITRNTYTMRILLFSWGVFSLIIGALFCGNLTAMFSVKKRNLPFRNLNEMTEQTEYKWGMVAGEGNVYEHIFMTSRSSDMMATWKGALNFNHSDPEVLQPNNEIHLRKLRDEKYAYIHDRWELMTGTAGDCNIRIMGQDIIFDQQGIGVPSDYPLSGEFQRVLMDLTQSGLLESWKEKWQSPTRINCTVDESVKRRSLGDVQLAFYLLLAGFTIASVTLGLEILRKKIPGLSPFI